METKQKLKGEFIMFAFNRKRKEEYDYIGKLIDQQGDILKIVADQREVIKELQATVKELKKEPNKEKVEKGS